MKRLSILVPAYNVEKTLSSTLDSICLPGIIHDLDVIIVDDGSTDHTGSIAEQYRQRYPESVRVIRTENGGHGSTINTGIRCAEGTYFKIVDGDDRLDDKGLASLLQKLGETSTDLVASPYEKVPMDGGKPVPMRFEGVDCGRVYSFRDLKSDGRIYLGIHSITIKTAILRKMQEEGNFLQRHTFYVDTEYALLPLPFVQSLEFTDQAVYLYSVGSSGQSIDPDNFVKRYDHHDRVVKRLVGYTAACRTDDSHRAYMKSVLVKLCFTNYMLSAFYDKDTARGKQRAKEFDRWLKNADEGLYKELGKSLTIRFLRLTGFSFLPGGVLKSNVRKIFQKFKTVFRINRKMTY